MGLTFLLKTTYLLPLMGGMLVAAMIGLGFRAGQRHGYGPLSIGIVSAVVLMVGKFAFLSDVLMYCGGGLLIAASLWNSWPRKQTTPTVVELKFPCD